MLTSPIFLTLVCGFSFSVTARVLQRVEDVAGKEFDYVIAGGGTAGLTVADRLSEGGECRF